VDQLNRLAEYGVTDRAALDALLDAQWVGVLSTLADGRPLAVPLLYARDGDRVLIHGSTGAGTLRRVADGWPATPEEADADPRVWSGLVPVRTVLDPAVPAPWSTDLPVPPSVRRLTD
jgi:hypothetical protein